MIFRHRMIRQMEHGLGRGCGPRLYAACVVVVVIVMLAGCTTTKYVPMPEVHTEHHWHTDSVRQIDSVFSEKTTVIRELDSAAMAGYGIRLEGMQRAWLIETQMLRREIERLEALRADSAVKGDSIPVPVPVEVEVPAEISGWQWFQIWAGRIAMIMLAVAAVVVVVRWKMKKTSSS